MVFDVHMRIGRTVAGELREKNTRLWRKVFLLGCVFPDFLPHFPGHSIDKSQKLFDRLYHILSRRRRGRFSGARIRAVDSFLMGVLSHYAADYSCAAHQPHYTENMRRHMRYERDMSRFLKRNPQTLRRSFEAPAARIAAAAGLPRRLCESLTYHKCDNFADELTYAVDAVRMVCGC
ncbi:MAG: zinc dependent phospholipase C family protein [Oscillospiraceae bacterium]|nr:zinc dependent phospholipase C family protein [Oscillospiraceae bacterium]